MGPHRNSSHFLNKSVDQVGRGLEGPSVSLSPFPSVSAVWSLSHALLFATPCTAVGQVSLSSLSPGVCPSPCPLNPWCHPTTAPSVHPLLLLPSVLPRCGSAEMAPGIPHPPLHWGWPMRPTGTAEVPPSHAVMVEKTLRFQLTLPLSLPLPSSLRGKPVAKSWAAHEEAHTVTPRPPANSRLRDVPALLRSSDDWSWATTSQETLSQKGPAKPFPESWPSERGWGSRYLSSSTAGVWSNLLNKVKISSFMSDSLWFHAL